MAKTLFEAVNVEVRRGMGVVLSNHHVELKQGDIMVLEGPNGSGKSTLIEAVARLLPLEKGHISHAGTSVVDHEGRRKTSPINVTLVLQKNGLLGCERVQEHLNLAMKMTGSTVDTATFLEAFSLTHRANDNVSHLSQGQARKVAVLSALLPAFASSEPCLVLMDEPDAGLDDRSMNSLCEWISELHHLGHGLLISTHDERIKSLATVRHSAAPQTQPDHTVISPVANPASLPAMCILHINSDRLNIQPAEPTKSAPKAINAAHADGTCQ